MNVTIAPVVVNAVMKVRLSRTGTDLCGRRRKAFYLRIAPAIEREESEDDLRRGPFLNHYDAAAFLKGDVSVANSDRLPI